MTRAIVIHRLELKPGTDPMTFEELVRSDVFPGLHIVPQVDKTISHEFTKISWLASEHVLVRGAEAAGKRTYLWIITAPVDDSELATDDGMRAVESELAEIGDEFFSLGSTQETIASHKMAPFATRSSLDTYLEVAAFSFRAPA
jgi:hypothetical protein